MPGSMRKRGDSWEMRVYAGTDPETGKRKWVSGTTKGTRRAAQQELVEFAARVNYPRRMTSQATVANLLDDWHGAMSPNWSPTTARQTKSIIDCHLAPSLGDIQLQTLRTDDIDAFYGELRRSGFTSCSTGHWPKRFAGNGSGSIPPARRLRRRASRPRSIPRAPKRSFGSCLTWQRLTLSSTPS
jgi:hypothetical protein